MKLIKVNSLENGEELLNLDNVIHIYKSIDTTNGAFYLCYIIIWNNVNGGLTEQFKTREEMDEKFEAIYGL